MAADKEESCSDSLGEQALGREEFSDFSLVLEDGHELKCHKVKLAEASSFSRSMFRQKWLDRDFRDSGNPTLRTQPPPTRYTSSGDNRGELSYYPINHNYNMFGAAIQMLMASIKTLGDTENQDTIQAWFIQVTSMTRATRAWGDYLDKEWTAECENTTRGFTDIIAAGAKTVTAVQQSREVESLLNFICTYAPQLDSVMIRSEATSLKWLHDHVRKHYGCQRSARQMMRKMTILQRRPTESVRAFYNRFNGFYYENRIQKNDRLRISDKPGGQLKTAADDEKKCRYA